MNDEAAAHAVRLDESVRLAKDIGMRGGAPLGKTEEPAMVRATTVSTEGAFRVFRQLLDAHDLRYALYSILRLTDYRFISVFRFADGMIRSVAHVDRENLAVPETPETAESASYCCYVRSGDGPFVTVDAAADPRTEGHAKRAELRAYCGMPITSPDGRLLGTLCHYDPSPRDPAQLNVELLALVSDEIARRGLLA